MRRLRGLRRRTGLLLADVRGATGDLRYYPTDQWYDELLALKGFMRRAFQLLAYNEVPGDYAEFGSFGARTFTLAWGASRLVGHPARLWAFDSFQGLPEPVGHRDAHPGWQAGAMAMSETAFVAACTANGIPRADIHTVAGFYAATLAPSAGGSRPERIAFAYVDCDLYSSAVDVLRFLEPRLQHGMVIAFDDYYCFGPSAPSGERLAAGELFGGHSEWRLVPYIQWGWYGMSFLVERRDALPVDAIAW